MTVWTAPGAQFSLDYRAYLSQHDIVYRQPPRQFRDGFPIGNGHFGAMVFAPEHVEFRIAKLDVWDYRYPENHPPTHQEVLEAIARGGEAEADRLLDDRLPELHQYPYPCPKVCGSLRLGAKRRHRMPLNATIRGESQRLHLYDAYVTVQHATNDSQTAVTAFVHPHRNVLIIRQTDSQARPLDQVIEVFRASDETLGTDPQSGHDGQHVWLEYTFPDGFRYVMLAAVQGGQQSTGSKHNAAYVELVQPEGREVVTTIAATVVTSLDSEDPLRAAKEAVDDALGRGSDLLFEEHQAWWNDFWQHSFLDLEDKLLENLWYFNLYQLAATSRGSIAPGLYGLWSLPDYPGWHGDLHNDINIEQTYWPIFTSNHVELHEPYTETYFRALPKAKQYAEAIYGIDGARYPVAMDPHGNELTAGWYRYLQCVPAFVAQHFWWLYRYTLDEKLLQDRCYPVLKEVAKFYLGYLQRDEQGRWSIYPSCSPEQGPHYARNPTIDLALIRTVVHAAIEGSQVLRIDADLRARWLDLLEGLPSYPVADGELRDSETADLGIPLAHPSLLAPVFPAEEIEPSHPLAPVALKTLQSILSRTWRWSTLGEPSWDDSFTWPWLASIAARLARPDLALHYLYDLGVAQHLKPNGFFAMWTCAELDDTEWPGRLRQFGFSSWTSTTRDGREKQDVFTDGCSGFIQAINDLVLQSNERHIRVFPSVPERWSCRFGSLRAQGGFLVSSELRDGQVRYVAIHSLVGGECRIVDPWPGRRVWILENGQQRAATRDESELIARTGRGSTSVLWAEDLPLPEVMPVIGGQPRTSPRLWTDKRNHLITLGK